MWKAIHKLTKKTYAIKIIDKIEINRYPILQSLFQTEITIMHEIDHPNILHLYNLIECQDYYYLILQYCKDGNFQNYQKKHKKTKYWSEKQCVAFFKQIANAFFELRKHKVLHRDFKLDNILVDDGKLIVGDFGFAKKGHEITSTRLGTPITMAPELLDPQNDNDYDSKIDLWSAGVVFYQILFQKTPFKGQSKIELLQSIKRNCGEKLKFPREVSEESKHLLVSMLQFRPKERLDWQSFYNHRLFTKFKPALQKNLTIFDSQFMIN